MLELRGYQRRSLDELASYLALATKQGAKTAFVVQTDRPYRSVAQLPGLPYVCLRVPTGGGKTLMACHALGIAARTYRQADRAVCLWLVPSNTIREQTLAALRNREHPYRQAVDASFSGQVRVMDLTEALYVQRGSLEGETVIIVSTLAALRVEDTEGRKVYEPAGALSHHFTGLSAALEALLEKGEEGTIPHSLANVLRLWRPVVIMDEAHNARTPLSFDTLARFNPSCIIEFTATPETIHTPERERFASNILCHVSAAELKAEEMVKLPIKLRTHEDWREIVSEALQTQRALEEAARDEEKQTGEHIRPLVLLQAQPRSQERPTLTVDVVKKCLTDDFRVPEEQIAVATGETRQIEDVNLLDPGCPLRFVITVQALKEGWDCPFAYVLCSVAEIGSTRAVEQILGRILRMPLARKKLHPELNCAYAFAASRRFIEAANALKDALIENGFQRLEATDLVVPQEAWGYGGERGALPFPISERVSERPDLSGLEPSLQARVSYDESAGQLTVAGGLSEDEATALQACFSREENRLAIERITRMATGLPSPPTGTPATSQAFHVPALAIRVGQQLELLEESHFLDTDWNLAACDVALSEVEFSSEPAAGATAEVDVSEAGRIEVRFVERLHEQLALLTGELGWTVASLASWLDREIPHPDIPQPQSSLFIHRAITFLVEERGIALERLAREKFRLRSALQAKIDGHRRAQAKQAYQALLFGRGSESIEVSPELCFSYNEDRYSPNWYYEGSFAFARHYFSRIGELKPEGEEFECAVFLDSMPQVKYWVRNVERRPDSSFWLQTSSDKFYPDFLAKLEDGRTLVVEYKGEHLWSNDDSKEKRAVGELWAERSGGRCLFVMTQGADWPAIERSLGDGARPGGRSQG